MVRVYTRASGFAAALGALIVAAPASAQDNNTVNSTVGSPLLRDFTLPGTKTTPPVEQPAQPPAATPSPPQRDNGAPAPATTVSAATAPVGAPVRTSSGAVRPKPAPLTAPPPPASGNPASGVIAPVDVPLPVPAPVTAPALAAPEAAPLPAASPDFVMWTGIAAALAALGGLFLFMRRRRLETEGEVPQSFARAASPERAPVPVRAAPIPEPAMKVDLRPWLELEFRPEKMVATATEATVHFELLVKNSGKSEARNVSIQARMFNVSATQKQEIGLFFATPLEVEGEAMVIAPHLAAKFNSAVVMPKSSVREIQIQGRSLFIPTVAINILYEWGDGRKGQTSNCYVIGTEAKEQSDKMGPFRLDLGPRIYRQVGGRPIDLARAV